MSRKLQTSIWRNGYRRSPRISALDAGKAQRPTRVSDSVVESMEQDSGNELGPPSWTRAPKKRKLRSVEQVGRESLKNEDRPKSSDQPSAVQAKDSAKHEDHASYTGQPSTMSSALGMPEKRKLELILDILQRRDTHEIFAEPVDPDEVEDYYEIIKEPMDFGTMRAKLHEGLYKNIEQFEHDVFLISRNAMHFNSSGTIFFRQARAIHELAKKVFHVLRTEPENLELEFSQTRRRPGRRPQGEAKGSNLSSLPKDATNVRSSNTVDQSSKGVPCSLSGSLLLNRGICETPWYSGRATHIDSGNEIPSVARDGRGSTFPEADRRCTYKPWTSFLNENDSIASTIYSNPKFLTHVDQNDIGYKESLMLFVKDLGPTAQMVAKRKLLGWQATAFNCQTPTSNLFVQAPNCQNPAPSASTQCGPSTLNAVLPMTSRNYLNMLSGHPTSDEMHLGDAYKEEKAASVGEMGIHGASVGAMTPNSDGKIAYRGEGYTRNGVKFLDVSGRDEIHQHQSTGIQLGSYGPTTGSGDLNFLNVGSKNSGNGTSGTSTGKSTFGSRMDFLGFGGDKTHQHRNTEIQLGLTAGGGKFSFLDVGNKKSGNRMGIHGVSDGELVPNNTGKDTLGAYTSSGMNVGRDRVHQHQNTGIQFGSSGVKDLNFSNVGNKNLGIKSCQTKGSIHDLGSQEHAIGAPRSNGGSSSSQTGQTGSQYKFDLPYLKSQLNQMTSWGFDKYSQRGEEPFKMSNAFTRQAELSTRPFLNNQQKSSLATQQTDLALQL